MQDGPELWAMQAEARQLASASYDWWLQDMEEEAQVRRATFDDPTLCDPSEFDTCTPCEDDTYIPF